MLKTYKTIQAQDREKIGIPKTAQDAIPVRRIWDDGIFLVGKNKYSKMFCFQDVNYSSASDAEKMEMTKQYCHILNSFDVGATTKITINNRRMNMDSFKRNILMRYADDGLDSYRREYNRMLLDKAEGSNSIMQEKYVTVSVCKRSIEEARAYFARVFASLFTQFNQIGSHCDELNAEQRLHLFHDFFYPAEEGNFQFNLRDYMRLGHDFKDVITPESLEFESDYFKFGDRFGRVLFLKDYANTITDKLIPTLCEFNRNLMLSIDIIPLSMSEAIQELESRLLGIETNIAQWQRKQNENNNFSAMIPFDMLQRRDETADMLGGCTSNDQRLMLCVLTLVHTADSKEQLDSDTEAILASTGMSRMAKLRFQQWDGLNTVLPYGVRKIDMVRTLTTDSLSIFTPFRAQEINHPNGVYFGQNRISKNLIIIDRSQLINGNAMILGVSGAGKSFICKSEFVARFLADPNSDHILIDPEREYTRLTKALKGEVITVSSTSKHHINAMDLNKAYGGDADPVILKSQFLMSLCELMINDRHLGAKEKSIIDRCTTATYRYYKQGNYTGEAPTLQDFYDNLLKQKEPEARDLAVAIEMFVVGNMNTFAHQTNVNTKNRLICYDIHELDESLQSAGMLIVLDSIFNRITRNKREGRTTYIYIDEIYLLFQNEYSANFLHTLWKRVRKYGAFCTGITQNISDLLQSHTARTMLSNSELLVMLNQGGSDKNELADLLNISENQKSFIENVGSGQGLLKVGSSLVPFINQFPTNTALYNLMNTKVV